VSDDAEARYAFACERLRLVRAEWEAAGRPSRRWGAAASASSIRCTRFFESRRCLSIGWRLERVLVGRVVRLLRCRGFRLRSRWSGDLVEKVEREGRQIDSVCDHDFFQPGIAEDCVSRLTRFPRFHHHDEVRVVGPVPDWIADCVDAKASNLGRQVSKSATRQRVSRSTGITWLLPSGRTIVRLLRLRNLVNSHRLGWPARR
jgi:transposase InsO family protein